MEILKYLDFIKENNSNLGEWIESLIDDDYIKNIVNRFIGEIDPSIRLSNAINVLDKQIQSDIKFQVDNYLLNGIEEKNPDIIASTETEDLLENNTLSGKGVFSSFLKILTALGQKNSEPNFEKCPNDFLLYYQYNKLNSNDVKSIFSRFKSMILYMDLIDYRENEVNLYFGIRCNGTFEYGICYDKLSPIGIFKLSQSVLKWLVTLESLSANSLKKQIVNLTYSDILILGKVKSEMDNYNPGYHEQKMKPVLSDKILTFAYYGIGKWDNGKLDEGEFSNLKTNFMNWIMTKKWCNKVMISIKPSSFWLYIHIKVK